VTGVSWQDHQWGHFVAGTGGWTWFSVQLANDTQYMIYLIHDASGNLVQKVGTKITPGGSTVNLDPGQITSTVLKTWTSPVTGSEYPTQWKVGVPGGQFTVTALEQNQELTVPTPNGPSGYWEGNSTAKGTINGVPVSGQAYGEITPNFTMP
jgi:predicted secreted hydrolase